jgi:hypothetical protein
MSRSRFACLALLALALPIGLAACGGGDGGDDEGDITEVIETSVKSTNPDDCTELETQNFLEQTEFETGEEAVQECRDDAADSSDDPDSVEVSNVQVDGDAATATVAVVGGPLSGATLAVALVKDGDQWKLDRITDVPQLDVDAFKAAFSEEIAKSANLPGPVITCMANAFNSVSEEQVKQLLVSGSQQQLLAIFQDCIPSA